jgi:hypothetical protein
MFGDERPESTGSDAAEYTGVPIRTTRPRKDKLMADQPGVTMEQVFQLIGRMDENNQKNMLLAIAEMKKPSAIEQEKLDKEAAKLKTMQENRLKMAQAQERAKELSMAGCRHATINPATGVAKHAWRAQVHTPKDEKPYFVPICLINQCQIKDEHGNALRILATPDMLTQGVNLDQYAGLDLDALKRWAQSQAV